MSPILSGSTVLLLRTMAPKPHNPLQALVSLVSLSALAMPVALAESTSPQPGAGEGDGSLPSRPAPAVDPLPALKPQAPSASTVIRPAPSAEPAAKPVVKSTVPSARPPLVAPPQAPASPVRQPPATARQERLRPGAEQKRPTPPPSFDKSLDALVRDGVVKPSERVRVRGNLVLPTNSALRQQACSNGALSVQECNSGVVFLGRGRRDGKGSMPLSGLHGAGVEDGSLSSAVL